MRRLPFPSRHAALCLGTALVLLSGGRAFAQMESREGISLQNQILELRQEVQQLQASGGGGNGGQPMAPPMGAYGGGPSGQGGGDMNALAPQLLDRVQTLEQQVRDMRGQIDQLNNQVQTQTAQLQKQIGDMNFAMQQGQGGGAPPAASGTTGPAPAAPAAAAPAAPPAPVHRTPESSLAAGNAALSRRDYAAAQAAAEDVLAGPRSPRQIDAQFLLGQSLAGQHHYQQAAVAYYDAYNRSPKSGRAPDALLGVGASLLALGDKGSACQALAKLHSEFPSPAARVKTAYSALRARGGCH